MLFEGQSWLANATTICLPIWISVQWLVRAFVLRRLHTCLASNLCTAYAVLVLLGSLRSWASIV